MMECEKYLVDLSLFVVLATFVAWGFGSILTQIFGCSKWVVGGAFVLGVLCGSRIREV